MLNSFPFCSPKQSHFWAMLLTLFVILSASVQSFAAVPVVLAPVPKLQFFDASGRPLAFGCVFTYQSGTTTPLATYTEFNGVTQNPNPVILDAGGFVGNGAGSDGIWLAAGQAYTIKVKSAGGTNCASGSTLYSIDGIGGGVTILTTIETCTGTCPVAIAAQFQLFEITLTGNTVASPITAVGITPPAFVVFEMIQDSSGGHTWTWPSNSVGGCTIGSNANQVSMQEFVWDGTKATAIGPCVVGNGPAINTGVILATGTIQTSQQFISTIITGTPPLVVASATQVANLNSSLLEGGTWQVPGTIGSTTPNTGAFTTFTLGGGTTQTTTQGTDTHLLTAGTVAAGTALPFCTDAQHGATTTCTGGGPFFAPQKVSLGSPVALTANTQTIVLTESVSFPAGSGTYRADVRYGAWITATNNACAAEVIDTTNTRAFALHGQDANGSGFIGLSGSEISTATYAASATATFTLQIQCNSNQSVTVNSDLFTFSPAEASYLSVTPVQSN